MPSSFVAVGRVAAPIAERDLTPDEPLTCGVITLAVSREAIAFEHDLKGSRMGGKPLPSLLGRFDEGDPREERHALRRGSIGVLEDLEGRIEWGILDHPLRPLMETLPVPPRERL
jgi:hypothetical protein